MDRTLRATLLAALIALVAVAGLGMFLGFEAGASVLAGLVAAALAGLLLWGASRRAETFHPTDDNAHLRGVQPGFPGPPEPASEATAPDEPEVPSGHADAGVDDAGRPSAAGDEDDLTDGDDRG